MTRRRHLRDALARQWILFTAGLLIALSSMSVVLLYVLEDQFIADSLRENAALERRSPAESSQRVQRVPWSEVDDALRIHLANARPNAIREFRLADGRYLHALVTGDTDATRVVWIYDASGQLYVNRALAKALPWLVAIVLLLVLTSGLLARRFIGGVMRQLADVFDGRVDLQTALRAMQKNADVEEFRQLAAIAADALQDQQDMLVRERETLGFLAHELRTPLQSARTSMAVLQNDRSKADAWSRLQRSVSRLARASHAALWMASARRPSGEERCEAAALIDTLIEEFQPLAKANGMTLMATVVGGAHWPLPFDVAESVMANLLLNAIQHGGPGAVHVYADTAGFHIDNTLPDEVGEGGFGMGLVIVNRLLSPFGGQAAGIPSNTGIRYQVEFVDAGKSDL